MKTKKPKYFIFAGIIAIAIIAGILITTNGTNSKFKNQMKLGNEALLNMDYETAITAFTNAIGLNPKDIEAYLGITKAYLGLGNHSSAADFLTTAYYSVPAPTILSMIDSINVKDLTILGNEFLSKGEANLAKDAFEEVLKKEPSNEDAVNGKNDAINHPSYSQDTIPNENINTDIPSNDSTSSANNSTQNPDTGIMSEEELLQCSINIGTAYANYVKGEIDNDRVEALCDYWLPILEFQKTNNIDLVDSWGIPLTELYYMNKDFAALTNLLNELYELTGSETYLTNCELSTSSHLNGTMTLNEYGQITHEYYVVEDSGGYTEDLTTTYNADGKVATSVMYNVYVGGEQTMRSEITNVYDNQGRIISSTDNTLMTDRYSGDTSKTTVITYTYNGDSVTQQLVVTMDSYSDTIETTGTMGEYGIVWNY